MALTKSDIFKQSALPVELVAVPEWGGAVYVRTLTAGERDAYESSCVKVGKGGKVEPSLLNARGRLAALAICDEKGSRLFDDDDANELGRKNARALDRVCEVAKRLSGMGEDSTEQAEKNSESAPSGGSSSDSPYRSVTPSGGWASVSGPTS